MKDPAAYNLNERFDWFVEPDGNELDREWLIEEYGDDDGNLPSDLLLGEVTVASFDYESYPSSSFYLKARQDGGRIRLRTCSDEESYPGEQGEGDIPLPITEIDEPFSAGDLIRFLDSVEDYRGVRGRGWLQGDLIQGSMELSREARQKNADFVRVDTIYEGANEWYQDVKRHFVETGELVYLKDLTN